MTLYRRIGKRPNQFLERKDLYMRTKHQKKTCERCGKVISESVTGSGLLAHRCPHGKQCIGPAWGKGRGMNLPLCPYCRPRCCDEMRSEAMATGSTTTCFGGAYHLHTDARIFDSLGRRL